MKRVLNVLLSLIIGLVLATIITVTIDLYNDPSGKGAMGSGWMALILLGSVAFIVWGRHLRSKPPVTVSGSLVPTSATRPARPEAFFATLRPVW